MVKKTNPNGPSLFIGRYQPFHDGHKKLIDMVLSEGKRVVIAVKETPFSEKNPYTLEERIGRIKRVYGDNPNIDIISIPDIAEVCYGRDVGWGIRRIRLDKQTEEISATKIRGAKKGVVWLTGNSGSGKTSIAYLLKENLNAVVLDGDEMRSSISADLGFSKEHREENYLRVARLAKVLVNQNHNVVVSVIAAFEDSRKKINEILSPYWIYVKGGETGPDKPYEPPTNPDLVIDPSEESLLQSMERIVKEVTGVAKTI